MAHSVHTPPASRTPQSIRRLLLPLVIPRRTLKFARSNAAGRTPARPPSSKFRAPAATPLTRARAFLGVRRLQKAPFSSPSPLLSDNANRTFELLDSVARARLEGRGSWCSARPSSFQFQFQFHLQSLPSSPFFLLLLRALDPKRRSGSCSRSQPQASGSQRLAQELPQSRVGGNPPANASLLVILMWTAHRGSPYACTACLIQV
ncbi:hypothetical protein GSI_14581 [Ganoderma sinense ZZ0214-1]|uniref:Uncharacterized protein n=1 Tax=Ganoderma sinense ZZ0214-1 TaxID=1077348 RepID=A0A2G8RP50_9APHY|nr:hypothetical protein GSI_14581 [Ganoderma sinense ZZ0214-1]